MNKDRLLEGMILGGLVGVVLGALFAPETGEKTRSALQEKLKELNLGEIVERFSEAFEVGKGEAERMIKEVEM